MATFNDTPLPQVSQDPTQPAFAANPYPFYERLRAMGDFVFWNDMGMAVATTHSACSAVLKSTAMGRRVPVAKRVPAADGLEAFYRLEKHSLLELEPPEHTHLRQIAMKGFGRNRLAPLALEISRIADSLIDAFPDGTFDLKKAFAQPLPAIAITQFLGVPLDMAGQLQSWSNDMVAMYQSRRNAEVEAKAAHAAQEFADFLTDFIKVRRRIPGDAFVDDLIRIEADGKSMTEAELLSTIVLLLNAGHEASVHSIGNSIVTLIDRDDRSLALAPEHIADTVEECLRYRPPLHLFTRHVYKTVDVAGFEAREGQEIGCLLGSACRDDAVWPDASVFDPFRLRRSHLAFGSGIHVCIGASLARLEMQIALPALFSRCPEMRLAAEPQISNLYHFHGYEALMATVK